MESKFEKYKIFKLVSRIVLGVVYAITLTIMIICPNIDITREPIPIGEESIKITSSYDAYDNTSTVKIAVISPTSEGDVYIDLTIYDSSDKVLIQGWDKQYITYSPTTFEIYDIEGKVARCEIHDCLNVFPYDSYDEVTLILLIPSIFLLAYFIDSLQIKNDIYNVNGTKIHVYLGFRKHELYINDKLVDYSSHLVQFGSKKIKCLTEDKYYEVEYKGSRKYKLKVGGDLILRGQRIKNNYY